MMELPAALTMLIKLSKQYSRDEKILIVPSFQIGEQYLDSLVLAAENWVNSRLATPFSLAANILERELAESRIDIIGSVRTRLAIEEIIFNPAIQKKLSYFGKSLHLAGVVDALCSTINFLRRAGIKAVAIDPASFPEKSKSKDLRLILSEYEGYLKKAKAVDIPGLISLALEKEKPGTGMEGALFIVFAEFPFTGLEKKLIEKIASGRVTVLSHDPVYGLRRPQNYQPFSEPEEGAWNNSYLFRPEDLAGTPSGHVECFSAIGHNNEIREVFRRILENKFSLDSVEILTTDSTEYVPVIMQVAEKLGVKVTFGTGVPCSVTSPGRALRAFLDWVSSGFSLNTLRIAFQNGAICPIAGADKSGTITGPSLAQTLAASGAGGKLENYLGPLERYGEESSREAAIFRMEEEDEKAKIKEKTACLASLVKDFLEPVINTLKVKTISLAEFAALCRLVITTGCIIRSDKDRLGLGALTSRLEELEVASESELNINDARERILMFTDDINVAIEGPMPGKVHVSSLPLGGRSGRRNTFIIGLDNQRFPGKGLQDPILLDSDREKLSSDLPTTLERIRENIYAFAVTFAGLRGKVFCSYSSYDPIEIRSNAPSSLMLQAFRLATGKPDMDYTALQSELSKNQAGYAVSTRSSFLDETEAWFSKLNRGNRLRSATKSVLSIYPFLAHGIAAVKERETDRLTEYDGQLLESCEELDPCSKNGPALSASRIETLASCPRKYFLEYILHLEAPEEDEAGQEGVFPAQDRGSILHEVFKRFMKEIRDRKKELPSIEDRDLLLKHLDEVLDDYREKFPPQNEVLFKTAVEEMRRVSDIFLRMETSQGSVSAPVFFEVAFGMPIEEDSGTEEIASRQPVKINLKEIGSFKLRGRIDRIDRVGEHEYSVWDYKTGSDYKFRDTFTCKGGRLIQHALYSLAAQELLRKKVDAKARIVEAGYLFCGERTAGNRIRINQGNSERISEVLMRLFTVLKSGTFVATVFEDNDCFLCRYADVCRKDFAQREIKMKLENKMNKKLNPLSELADFE